MFTGLIQDIGTIISVQDNGPDRCITIETGIDLNIVSEGASIACSGCCLTAYGIQKNSFKTDVSAETLAKTSLGSWVEGFRVNIEPSLRLGDELGGHIVSGHVDGLAVLESIEQEGESYRLKLKAPADLAAFIAPKGSVSLDGISLTINEVSGEHFGVNIIPHSWAHTTLQYRKAGDQLNLEIDMLARYVARYLDRTAA